MCWRATAASSKHEPGDTVNLMPLSPVTWSLCHPVMSPLATHAPTLLGRRRERWFYLLITPWLIGFLCFQGGPLLGALALAFFEWRLP